MCRVLHNAKCEYVLQEDTDKSSKRHEHLHRSFSFLSHNQGKNRNVRDLPPSVSGRSDVPENLNINKYDFQKLIGSGRLGKVYLVEEKSNGKRFAVKVMKKQELKSLHQAKHALWEKEILSGADHNNIVKLYATFNDQTHVYMLMEYLPGGELEAMLPLTGRMKRRTSWFWTASLVLAIKYLHERQIVHRDIKPANVVVNRHGQPKLIDFGCAERMTNGRSSTRMGTPNYIAPEILLHKEYGLEVDWWSLGVLVFELLAGFRPFDDDNADGIFANILRRQIDIPAHFTPIEKDFVSRLMCYEPSKRLGFNGAEEVMSHPWFAEFDWETLAAGNLEC